MGDVGATSDRPEFGHELRIEHGAGTEPDDRRPLGGHGVRVGAHVSVRTPLRRDLRQVVSPVMRAVGPLASARDVRAIGSEPPSSSQIITGTLCADFRSDLGSLPVSAGVRAAARSSASRRTGTIVQLAAGRFVKLAQARPGPVRREVPLFDAPILDRSVCRPARARVAVRRASIGWPFAVTTCVEATSAHLRPSDRRWCHRIVPRQRTI